MQVLKTWKNQKKLIDQVAWRQGESDAEQGKPQAYEIPDVIGEEDGYVVTLFDNYQGRERWIEAYNSAYASTAANSADNIYTVVGIYQDNHQRWAESFYASSPEDAEQQVPQGIIVAGVFEGDINAVL